MVLDSTEKCGIVGCLERGDEGREFPNKPLHPAIGHLQEGVYAGHPCNEGLRILEGAATLASVHLGKLRIPLIDKVKREVELAALDQELIIYTPVTSTGVQASPTFVSWHEGAEGTSGIF